MDGKFLVFESYSRSISRYCSAEEISGGIWQGPDVSLGESILGGCLSYHDQSWEDQLEGLRHEVVIYASEYCQYPDGTLGACSSFF